MGKRDLPKFSTSPEEEDELRKVQERLLHPEYNLVIAVDKYVKKIGNADWGNLRRIKKERDWDEAELQAKLIRRRLIEIKSNSSLDAKRERAFLKAYVRFLLTVYRDGHGQTPGLTSDLIYILYDEYPGEAGVKKFLAFEEKRRFPKDAAIHLVKEYPNISQKKLVEATGLNSATIRELRPDLLAAGWKGPKQKSNDDAKRQGPVKPDLPKRGTPSMPKFKFMEGEEPEDV